MAFNKGDRVRYRRLPGDVLEASWLPADGALGTVIDIQGGGVYDLAVRFDTPFPLGLPAGKGHPSEAELDRLPFLHGNVRCFGERGVPDAGEHPNNLGPAGEGAPS